jgi:hypothetical protein
VQVVDFKLSGSQIKSVGEKPGAPTYIKYTPSGGGGAHNSGASHRVIRMSEVQVDPLEPPKFRHKKVLSELATVYLPQLSVGPMVLRFEGHLLFAPPTSTHVDGEWVWIMRTWYASGVVPHQRASATP